MEPWIDSTQKLSWKLMVLASGWLLSSFQVHARSTSSTFLLMNRCVDSSTRKKRFPKVQKNPNISNFYRYYLTLQRPGRGFIAPPPPPPSQKCFFRKFQRNYDNTFSSRSICCWIDATSNIICMMSLFRLKLCRGRSRNFGVGV